MKPGTTPRASCVRGFFVAGWIRGRVDPWPGWTAARVDPRPGWIRGQGGSVARVDRGQGGSAARVEIGRFSPGRSAWPVFGRGVKKNDFRPALSKNQFPAGA